MALIKSARGVVCARRALLCVSTILASGIGVPAFAQNAHPNPDANGVDLTMGTFAASIPIASIGSGSSELAIIAYGKTDNWGATYSSQSRSGNVTSIMVSIGRQWDVFKSTDNYASSIYGTGARLTVNADNSVTYRTLDGQTVTFGDPTGLGGGALCGATNAQQCTRLPLSRTDRSKLETYFDWETYENCPQVEDPAPSTCTYSWRLNQVGNSAGYTISFGYSQNSVPARTNPGPAWYQRTSAVLGNASRGGSRSVTYTYPSSNVTQITTPGGKVWRITGDMNTVSAIRVPGSSADNITVNYTTSSGPVSSVTNDGVTTSYARSVSGNQATEVVTDALGRKTTVVSDIAKQRPLSVSNSLGSTSYAYDAVGRLTETTLPEGNKVQYAYDGHGNLIETRRKAKPSVGGADLVTSASYDTSCGGPATCDTMTWSRDAKNAQTDYGYEASTGLLARVTGPSADGGATRPQSRYSYTIASNTYVLGSVSTCRSGNEANCVGTANETKQSLSYDANLNVSGQTVAAGDGSVTASAAMTYNVFGDLIGFDGPIAGSADMIVQSFDADRQRTLVVGPDPDGSGARRSRAATFAYNGRGQITTSSSGVSNADGSSFTASQTLTSTFDGNGRKIQDTVSAGGSTINVRQYSYDALGRSDCTALRMNPATFGSLPAACSAATAGSFGPDRISKITGYDAADRVTEMTSAYGTADATTEQMTYTANGQTAAVRDGNGNWTAYAYDGQDRSWRTCYQTTTPAACAGSPADFEQATLDANGNVTSRRLRDGQTLTYDYDALNRRTYDHNPKTNVAEVDVSYSYDLLGHLLSAGDGNGWTKTFGYDGLGRATQQGSNVSSTILQYDAAGRMTRQTWADGFFVTYEYDAAGNMTFIRENGGLALASFGYDDLGRRTSLTRGNGTVTSYGYDGISRLSSLTQDLAGGSWDQSYTFGYNPAGQITSRTSSNDAYAWTGAVNADRSYGVNGLNQYTSAGGTAFGYDARGNLNNSGGTTYQYNSRNQLFMNAPGQLFYRNPAGELGQTPGMNYDWVNGQLATETNGGNSLQRRYVYGPGADEVLVWYEGSGTGDRRYLHADERGSIVAVSNNAGNALAINSYDEYGIPGTNNQGRFQYTGQIWQPELGMYDFKARMYSPTLGRFMQTDPIGYGDGLNWYNYVGGDPVNSIDPSGMFRYPCGSIDTSHSESYGGWMGGVVSSQTIYCETPDSEWNYRGSHGRNRGRFYSNMFGDDADPGPLAPAEPQNKQCYGPPAAPGTGSTKSELAAQSRNNAAQAASRYWNPLNLLWFRSQVQNKGPWDYKQYNRGYQDFGNYNYGRTGAAMGLATDFLLGQAGRAQQAAGTSMPEWGNPGFLGFGGLGGTGSYGDDPRDQEMIKRGISDQANGC